MTADDNSPAARAARVRAKQEADAKLPLNRRMRALLAYYGDPFGVGALAYRQYRGRSGWAHTAAALKRRGLTLPIDKFPYTALTPTGEAALKQPRQDVPK